MCSFERCCRTFFDSCLILVHCRWNLWWMLPKNCSFNQENDDTPIHSWTLGRLALKQTQIYAKSMVTHLETEKDGEHIDKRLFSMGNIKTCSSFRRRATHLTRTWGNFSQPRSKKTFAPGMFDVMKMMSWKWWLGLGKSSSSSSSSSSPKWPYDSSYCQVSDIKHGDNYQTWWYVLGCNGGMMGIWWGIIYCIQFFIGSVVAGRLLVLDSVYCTFIFRTYDLVAYIYIYVDRNVWPLGFFVDNVADISPNSWVCNCVPTFSPLDQLHCRKKDDDSRESESVRARNFHRISARFVGDIRIHQLDQLDTWPGSKFVFILPWTVVNFGIDEHWSMIETYIETRFRYV